MDHAQKPALQSTNGISGLGPRRLHLPPYTPALFLARRAATFVAYPAQNEMTDMFTQAQCIASDDPRLKGR
jgi:hypothetical protein